MTEDDLIRLLEKEPRLSRRPLLLGPDLAVAGFDRAAYEALVGKSL